MCIFGFVVGKRGTKQSVGEDNDSHVSAIFVEQVGICFYKSLDNIFIDSAQFFFTEFKNFIEYEGEGKPVMVFDNGANGLAIIGGKNFFRRGNGEQSGVRAACDIISKQLSFTSHDGDSSPVSEFAQ